MLNERSRLGGPRHAGPAAAPFSSARFARNGIEGVCVETMAPIVPDHIFLYFYKYWFDLDDMECNDENCYLPTLFPY